MVTTLQAIYITQTSSVQQVRHELNTSISWWMVQLMSGKNDWERMSVQKMASLIVLDAASLQSSCYTTQQCNNAMLI